MDKNKKILNILLDALTAIAHGDVKPFFSCPEYAKNAIERAYDVLKPPLKNIQLETDAERTDAAFSITQAFVDKFVTDENQVKLELMCEYDENVMYKITFNFEDSKPPIEWLNKNVAHYSFDEDGIHMWFEIGIKTGTESAYLTMDVTSI